MYQILARKWRPKNFSEVIGQRQVVQALTNSLEQQRLHHAYLFAGTRGVGKTTLARIFARCLNCEKDVTAEPCGECNACVQISEGRYPDLIEIDAASRTGVDDMRELLESAQYRPVQGRRKVYLIDEVHMLSISSFNALLKTLEEPPEHIMFLFATTHPKKIPITVLSRCLQLNLTRLLHSEIADYMVGLLKAEKIDYEDDAVREIATAADGSMRDGLSLLDQAVAHGAGALKTESVREMLGVVGRDEVGALLDCIADGDADRLLKLTDALYAQSADFIGIAKDMVMFLHSVAIAQVSPKTEVDVQFNAEQVRSVAQKISPEDAQLFYQFAVNGLRDMTVLPNVRRAFEMICLRMLSFKPLTASLQGGGTPTTAAAPKPSAPPSTTPNTKASASAANGAPPAATQTPQASDTAPATQAAAAPEVANGAAVNGKLATYQDNADAWLEFVDRLPDNMIKEVCKHSVLQVASENEARLLISKEHDFLLTTEVVTNDELSRAFSALFGRDVSITLEPQSSATETPHQKEERRTVEARQRAATSIENSPLVQGLKEKLSGHVVPGSVRSVEDKTDKANKAD